MKFCSKCGHPLRPNTKICTQCGTPIKQTTDTSASDCSAYQRNHRPKRKKSKKLSRKSIIAMIVIAVLLATLVTAFIVLKHQLSPVKTATHIAQAIEKDDAKSLAKQVKTGNRQLTEEEARAYLNYLKTTDNLSSTANQLKSKTQAMEHQKENSSTIGLHGMSIFDISQDGKQYALFNKYKFSIPQRLVYIRASEDGKVTYQFNDKKHDINVEKNNRKPLGTFSIGEYDLKATKKEKDKMLNGTLHITMNEDSAIATESFKQKRFTIYMKNGNLLDEVNIYINDKSLGKWDALKVYGPYSPEEEVNVYAEGKLKDKTFKSDIVKVLEASNEGKNSDVALTFNEEEIKKYWYKSLGLDKEDDKDTEKESNNEKQQENNDDEKSEDKDSEETKESEDKSIDEITHKEDDEAKKMTLDNLLEIVEKYAPNELDKDKYTYGEPKDLKDDQWRVPIKDKDGTLVGSYTIYLNPNYVTKADQNGEDVALKY